MRVEKLKLIFAVSRFAALAGKVAGNLDFSVQSLRLIDEYLRQTVSVAGKPTVLSYFYKNTEDSAFDLGLYVGEVIRRHSKGVRWQMHSLKGSMDFSLVDAHGRMTSPTLISHERIYSGETIPFQQYAIYVIKNLFTDKKTNLRDFDSEDLRIHHHSHSGLVLISKKIIRGEAELFVFKMVDGIYFLESKKEPKWRTVEEAFDFYFFDEARKMFPEMDNFPEIDENYVIVRSSTGIFRRELKNIWTHFKSATSAVQMELKFSPLIWFKFNTFSVLSRTLILLLFLCLAILHSSWWWIGVLLAGYEYFHYWYRVWIFFKLGYINPGKVVSIDPVMVFTYHNLAKSMGYFPAKTISHHYLHKDDKQLGKIIPMVIYFGNYYGKMPFNSLVKLYPVRFGIKDHNIIDSLNDRFSEEDLEKLEDTFNLNTIRTEGLFKIDEEHSDWKDYTDFVDNETWFIKRTSKGRQ